MKKAIHGIILAFSILISLSVSANGDLKFGKKTSYVDKIGMYRYFQGVVYNKGQKAMQFVKIKMFFYDRRGKLLRIESTYTDPSTIAPAKIIIRNRKRIKLYGKATYTFMIDSSLRYKTYRIEANCSIK